MRCVVGYATCRRGSSTLDAVAGCDRPRSIHEHALLRTRIPEHGLVHRVGWGSVMLCPKELALPIRETSHDTPYPASHRKETAYFRHPALTETSNGTDRIWARSAPDN